MIIRPAVVVTNSEQKVFYLYTPGKIILKIVDFNPNSIGAMISLSRDILPTIKYAGDVSKKHEVTQLKRIAPLFEIQNIKKETRQEFFRGREKGSRIIYDLSIFYSQINKIGVSDVEMTYKYLRDHKMLNFYSAMSNGKHVQLCMPDFKI